MKDKILDFLQRKINNARVKKVSIAYCIVLCIGLFYMPLAFSQGNFSDFSYETILLEDEELDSLEIYMKAYRDNAYIKLYTLQVKHAQRMIVEKNHQNKKADRTWQTLKKFDVTGEMVTWGNYDKMNNMLDWGSIIFQTQDSICWNYLTNNSLVAFDSSHTCDFKDEYGNIIRRSSTIFTEGETKTSRFFTEYTYDQQGRPLTVDQYRYRGSDQSQTTPTKELTYATKYSYQKDYTRIENLDIYRDKKITFEKLYKDDRLVKEIYTRPKVKIIHKYIYQKDQLKRIIEKSNSLLHNTKTKVVYYRS